MGKNIHGVRLVAILEAAKGALVLLAGFGLLSLIHRNAAEIAEALITRIHLDPAAKYPHIFLVLVGNLSNARLWLLAFGAGAYSTARFIEAYGLWLSRRWAEWIAAGSGGIYIPVEVYELFRHATWIKFCAFCINICIVLYMLQMLRRENRNVNDGR